MAQVAQNPSSQKWQVPIPSTSAAKLKWEIPTLSGNDARSFDKWDNTVLAIVQSLPGGQMLVSFILVKTGREQLRGSLQDSIQPQYLAGDAQLRD